MFISISGTNVSWEFHLLGVPREEEEDLGIHLKVEQPFLPNTQRPRGEAMRGGCGSACWELRVFASGLQVFMPVSPPKNN